MGVVAAALAVLEGRDPDRSASSSGAAARTGPPPTTKMDRVPSAALLPNLVVLPAEELRLSGRDGRRVLRFATVLTNRGAGPLQIRPVREEVCPPGQRYVEQRVFLDADRDRGFDRRRDRGTAALPGGCMVFHPRHDHWHFDSTAEYRLTTLVDPAPIVSRDKVSFCLRDSEPLRGAAERHRRMYEDCARNRIQGISVGWADRYDATLSGQRLPLPTGFADGVYCLRLEVDPFDLLTEADESDNTSAVAVSITGRSVSRAASSC